MSQKTSRITLLLCVLAVFLSGAALIVALCTAADRRDSSDVQYVLYLGTNDKDLNTPVFEPETAKKEAEKILIEHFGGFTIQEANGGWIDGGTVYREYTLVIHLSDTSLDEVHKAADDLIKVFNQSSVLIQENRTATEFYAGK